jgi:hypothetical protein
VRAFTSVALAAVAVAIFIGSLVWAWATFDFWEIIPLFSCVLGSALFAASATYVSRRKLFAAVAVGFAFAIITFIVTFAVTSARWGS